MPSSSLKLNEVPSIINTAAILCFTLCVCHVFISSVSIISLLLKFVNSRFFCIFGAVVIS